MSVAKSVANCLATDSGDYRRWRRPRTSASSLGPIPRFVATTDLLCNFQSFNDMDNPLSLNPSTGSSILLHQREAGVILTPRILWCILFVLNGVLNANQLISPRRNASGIILLHPRGGIAIRHVCLFVRLCVRKHVLGRNILKTIGDSCSVAMKHL